jgi:nucleoid DNA-binding protein
MEIEKAKRIKPNTLGKKEIIKEVQRELAEKKIYLTTKEIEAVLDSFFETIKKATFEKGYRLSYRPYGTFEKKKRINPKKEKEIIEYVHFKTGSKLKEKG